MLTVWPRPRGPLGSAVPQCSRSAGHLDTPSQPPAPSLALPCPRPQPVAVLFPVLSVSARPPRFCSLPSFCSGERTWNALPLD